MKTSLEKDIRTLERKVTKLQSSNKKFSVSSQTHSTIDTPYQITDSLPPIFGSKLCWTSKSVFLSKSLPMLNQISWVTETEEDILRERADEALDYLYDMEIASFYEEAKKKAASLRNCKDLG